MKRRIVLELDDSITTAEMAKIGGCEDAFGLTMYACADDGFHEAAKKAMAECGIRVVSDERIE